MGRFDASVKSIAATDGTNSKNSDLRNIIDGNENLER